MCYTSEPSERSKAKVTSPTSEKTPCRSDRPESDGTTNDKHEPGKPGQPLTEYPVQDRSTMIKQTPGVPRRLTRMDRDGNWQGSPYDSCS